MGFIEKVKNQNKISVYLKEATWNDSQRNIFKALINF